MEDEVTQQVAAGETPEVPAEGMLQGGEVSQVEATPPAALTPTKPATNAQGERPVTAEDLRRLQSTMDRRYAEQQQAFAQREAEYQRRLHEAETRGMNDDQRRAYELNRLAQENQQWATWAQQQQQAAAVQQQMSGWANWFEETGVPKERLDRSSPDALLESGWKYVREVLKNPAGAQPAAPVKPPVAAPAVMTNKGGAAQGKTWEGQKRKYNVKTDEELFRLVELGQIPVSELPFT